MGMTRRELLKGCTMFGLVGLLSRRGTCIGETVEPTPKPIEVAPLRIGLPRIPQSQVLNLFEQVTIYPGAVPEFPLDFWVEKPLAAHCNTEKGVRRVTDIDYVFVPFFTHDESKLNENAFQLVTCAAQDNPNPVKNPTHELVTNIGIVQVDMSRPDAFVLTERDGEYGMAILNHLAVGMKP